MQASSSSLEAALVDVVQRAGMASGAPVRFSAIAHEWARVGLRMSDLRDAIRELVDRRYATCSAVGGQLAFCATAEGLQRLARGTLTH